jgi:hypothetical protein
LQKYEECLNQIVKATTPLLYPGYRAALDLDVADFGPVRLTRDILTIDYTSDVWGLRRTAVIPWKRSVKVRLVRGHLSCQDADKKERKVPLADIANYDVLLRLLQERGWM